MCCECEDQEAAVRCAQCEEAFCRPCYQMQHRKGKRMRHTIEPMLGEMMPGSSGHTMGMAATATTAGTRAGRAASETGEQGCGGPAPCVSARAAA